ncbi:unnamed protein product [Phytophthora fragariaefolia]|uniref:Unnamed protein product n=1 Tax=Phytophthora fragariaefolia TaxID=1490495 RepID=A0A9W6YMX0_9STRA|nr:unnamed protein product [Phytophthora fragariaefolia]
MVQVDSHVEVETPLFQGHVSASADSAEVLLQGRFRRAAPPNCKVFVALELPGEPKYAVKTLLAVLSKVTRSANGVHVSCGDKRHGQDEVEMAHVAVLMQAQDKRQGSSFVVGKMYTLKAGIERWGWKCVAKVLLALMQWAPVQWMRVLRVQFAVYLVVPPSKREQQSRALEYHSMDQKQYLCCFALHRQAQEQLQAESEAESQRLSILLPREDHLPEFDVGSPIAMWAGKSPRGGVPLAHVEACRRIANNSRALGQLNFSLDAWVEFVDRVAGRRKVGYLLEVENSLQQSQRTVMRSASTIKNALLLLRLEHQLDRKETERETGIADNEEQDEAHLDEAVDFQRLTVESREYRYEQIEKETSAVAHVLQQVASKPCQGRRRWRQPQRCYQNQLEKATLYRCLMSRSRLPPVSSDHDIGVQINETQHLAMNVVCEAGIYRLHEAGDGTTPLLRQEWFIISADHLHFFRSFSVSPSLSVPVTSVLTVCSVDRVHLLNGNKPTNARHEQGAVSRWYCIEIHLVLEVITMFVETPEERDRLVASLQPLTYDDCDLDVQPSTVKGARTEAVAASPLFSPMNLNSQNQPVCLNQRTYRFVDTTVKGLDDAAILTVVRESLEAGLKVFALGETAARLRINRSTVLTFLDKVERLNGLDLDKAASELSNEDRFALGLNLYHTLFIHAVLIFDHPQSHEQWKLLQTVPCYLVRVNGGLESVRFTLSDIQRVMLRCPVPVTLEASSIKRSLSQNSLMDLAIGGGDAIDGLCRTVLGVAWTPVFPSSSSYSAIKKTPLPIPAVLAIDSADIRTSMVLQINSSPAIAKSTGIMRVYDGGQKLNEQLNATCTSFVSHELRLGEVKRVIYLPRVCEWYRIGHDEDLDAKDDGVSRRMAPLSQRRRSSSGNVSGLAALPKSRGFYCLQRLLGFMEVEQHHRVMHFLLGAGEECRFVFDDFWTRPSRSAAASLLTNAGNAALAVFTSSGGNKTPGTVQTPTASDASRRSDGDWFGAGQQRLSSYF